MLVVSQTGQPVDVNGTRRSVERAAWDCANRTAMAAYHSFPRDESLALALSRCGWTPSGPVDDVIDWMMTVDPQGNGLSLRGALPVHTYMWWGESDYMVVDQHSRGFAGI